MHNTSPAQDHLLIQPRHDPAQTNSHIRPRHPRIHRPTQHSVLIQAHDQLRSQTQNRRHAHHQLLRVGGSSFAELLGKLLPSPLLLKQSHSIHPKPNKRPSKAQRQNLPPRQPGQSRSNLRIRLRLLAQNRSAQIRHHRQARQPKRTPPESFQERSILPKLRLLDSIHHSHRILNTLLLHCSYRMQSANARSGLLTSVGSVYAGYVLSPVRG